MMQKIILFIFLSGMGCISSLQSQDCYIVIKVKGTITLQSTGEALVKDTRVCLPDEIAFGSKDAVAILYNASKGRFTLKADKSAESELSGMIKTTVAGALSTSRANVDTRGDEFDLKKIFKDNFVVLGSDEFFPDPDDYPLSDNNYFLLKYIYEGKEMKSRLINTGDSFRLDSNVYSINGNLINQDKIENVTLCYFDGKEHPVRTFRLRFPDTEAVVSELTPYISELKSSGKTNEEIINEVLYYIYDVYGSFSPENMKKWVKNKFELN